MNPENYDFILLMLLILLILPLVLSMFSARQRRQVELPKRTYTVIECVGGDHKEVREFRIGDFIGKVVGTCNKCGSKLIISLIYTETQKPPTTKPRKRVEIRTKSNTY